MRTRTRNDLGRSHTLARAAGFGPQRGIAMLLVLISLMMATVLATSYLSSRDNSAIIGENAVAAASARWAAESGMDFGAAILETEKSWRTAHSGGRLVSNYPLAGATVDIDLLDMETNQPPTAATENVKMTVTATIDGLKQTAVATAHVPVTTGPIVDVDLSEFAVFAATSLDMRGQSTLTRWPKAPLAALGDRIAVGTRSTTASAIALGDDAAAVDATVYSGPGASALLVAVAKGQSPEKVALPDPIPLPAAPLSGVAGPSTGYSDIAQNGGSSIVNANAHYNTLEIRSTGTRTLRGAITLIVDDDVRIRENAKLIIDGNVKLVVFGDVQLDTGAIELKTGAKLTAYIRGNSGTAFEVKDGYVGDLRANGTRDASGAAVYMDPERLTIYSVAGGNGEWRIRDNSVVKGSLYAPDAGNVTIQNQSAVYGRVAATNLNMSENAAVFYDPSLNDNNGFTKTDSALYGNGRLKAVYATIASLDTNVIQAAADATGTLVKTVFGLLTPSGYTPPAEGVVGPTDPTPRTIDIDLRVVSVGDALKSWE